MLIINQLSKIRGQLNRRKSADLALHLPVRVRVNSARFLSFHSPSRPLPLAKNSQSVVPSTNRREPVENDCKMQ